MNFELLICSDGLPHLVSENPMTGENIDIVIWNGSAWLVGDTDTVESSPESWIEIDLADFLSRLAGGEQTYGL